MDNKLYSNPAPIYESNYHFPDPSLADDTGVICIGGDLHSQTLIHAYSIGIFPWFNETEPIIWWCPNPRFVLYPANLKISKSMKQLLKKEAFSVTYNQCFEEVISHCKKIPRKNQEGTWITDEMLSAYTTLHKTGYAHSVEVWESGKLVGGFYGIKIGACFFGESMFSTTSNASKYGFICFVQSFSEEIKIIDCQIHTSHLESLGAELIKRSTFLDELDKYLHYTT